LSTDAFSRFISEFETIKTEMGISVAGISDVKAAVDIIQK
jgi:uncharacterized protein YerC